jgi:hypothetical protein
MLNNVVFINRLPADSQEIIIYRGDSRQIIQEAIKNSKWRFGSAAFYEKHGEGLQYPGESQAVDEFFKFNTDSSRTDALASRQIHDSINNSHRDQFNSCWSTSLEVARGFGRKYTDGVIISVKAQAFAERFRALALEWTSRANQARTDDLGSLFSGNQAGTPDTGWGQIHASATCIEYLPSDYHHPGSCDTSGGNRFMSPVYRNMRLPENHRGIDLQAENELRFSLDLSNSDGCSIRKPEGVANSLAPMITEALGAEGKNGIWLHNFNITSVEGFTLTEAWE